jgi:putative hydrolase of the HAD superfamily
VSGTVEVTALFWDVGGVILNNGWDRDLRCVVVEKFHLDRDEFQDRHELTNPAFEMGQISLDEYLHCTVFHRPRPFTPDEFKSFILEQSRELPESRAVLDAVTRTGKYFMAVISNEGREMNEYRIDRFDLRRNFAAFFSSCYVGIRKPDEAIFRLALDITRRSPRECLFIDDRSINVEYAGRLGMRTIQFQNAEQLRQELVSHGVTS